MDENAGDIIAAVAQQKIDTAIVWGPLAGYYAKQYGNTLRLTAVKPEVDPPMLPFTYELGVGVRKSDTELLSRIQSALQLARPKIQRILKAYNVPTLPMEDTPQERAGQ
jgi:ABC-type amino acid transport substrate-binding protein